ncbi:MAG: indole-3-glycerol phosphate synthase TrpC [Opitutales bacterium]|nr:indole-3-glycerol phosphate synthase TrpC [Opitutales bacterium]
MNGILEKITAKKRAELEASKREIPYEAVFLAAQNAPKRASFFEALKMKNGRPAVIAELKKASPSKGLIRENFEPASLAKSLEGAGASALSVLTEKNFFLGSPEYLRTAVANVKIPVLRKDFVFDKYQICEAKAWGASAVLLIKAMLSNGELESLMEFANSLNLDALVETHDAGEIDAALGCGAKILGVNARNLRTFEIDKSLFEKLVSKIPEGVKAVAESGIETPEALLNAAQAGADAALIGTTFMSKQNPAAELERLLK